jgi:hypothetical protein
MAEEDGLLPPFAKNAKDGAPTVSLVAVKSKAWAARPFKCELRAPDILRRYRLPNKITLTNSVAPEVHRAKHNAQDRRCDFHFSPLNGNEQRTVADFSVTVSSNEAQHILI